MMSNNKHRYYQKKAIDKSAIRWICGFLVFEVIIIFLLFGGLLDLRQATEERVERISGRIEEIRWWTQNPTEKNLLITIDGETYLLDRNAKIHTTDIEELQKNDWITITVKKKQSVLSVSGMKEVVDVRNESKVYYNVDDYNSRVLVLTIFWAIVGSLIWLFGTGYFVLMIWAVLVTSSPSKNRGKRALGR